MLRVRVDRITLDRLNESCSQLGTNRSDIIRKGIDMVHDALKK